jgi:hypothetical protein
MLHCDITTTTQDLTRITMPIVFNEPLSFLQRLAEHMEYVELVQAAAVNDDPVKRIEVCVLHRHTVNTHISNHPPTFNSHSNITIYITSIPVRISILSIRTGIES